MNQLSTFASTESAPDSSLMVWAGSSDRISVSPTRTALAPHFSYTSTSARVLGKRKMREGGVLAARNGKRERSETRHANYREGQTNKKLGDNSDGPTQTENRLK